MFKLLNEWSDDHWPCVSFRYRRRTFSIWWTGDNVIGAFLWSDSPRAQRAILKPLAKVLDRAIDEKWDNERLGDEDTPFGHLALGGNEEGLGG